MNAPSHHDITMLLLSLGILLGTARLLGELAQRVRQPAVVGEILAGILLGPTVLGSLAPVFTQAVFPAEGPVATILGGLTTLAIALFLLVAGMEVDLSTVWRQGGASLRIGVAGIVVPFGLGFIVAWLLPHALGREPGADRISFALFFATAISISALPIVAKILMDLNLYRSDFGMMVVAACVLNDLIGWMVIAIILSLAGHDSGNSLPLYATIGLTVGFAAFILTVGRWLFDRTLPWLQAYTQWPGGVLGYAMTAALLGAAFTEWIGIHAILGSFLVGVAIGDSSHLREQTRMIIDQFVSFIFAPLFFASIGLHVNFVTNFDPVIVSVVLVTAAVGKFGGCLLGARWARVNPLESRAVAFAMISVGAMGIIVGLLALEAGLIRPPLFVAFVIMALSTSIISGPMVQITLGMRKPRNLVDLLQPHRFIRRLKATTSTEAIAELTAVACVDLELGSADVQRAVVAREQILHTGIGQGLAVPHGRILGLSGPVIAVGLSEVGIDFDAPDGEPAHVVFLVLTPFDDSGAQLEIMASIGETFADHAMTDEAMRSANLTEFRAALKSRASTRADHNSGSRPKSSENG